MSSTNQDVKHIIKNHKKSFLVGNKAISDRKFKFLYAGIMGMALIGSALTGTFINGYKHGDFPKTNFSIVQQELSQQAELKTSTIYENNPLLLAGRIEGTSNIGFSIDKAVNAWFNAGMKIEDIEPALQIAEQLTPVVYGINSTDLKESHLSDAQQYQEILNTHLLDVQYNLINHIKVIRTEEETREKNHIVNFYKNIKFNAEATHSNVLNVGEGASYEQAIEALKKATLNSGVAYLKLPLSYYENPNLLVAAAERIDLANEQLQEILNIKGKALGLNGMVGLNIGRPVLTNEHGEQEAANGITDFRKISLNDQEPIYVIPSKKTLNAITNITTTWQALGHEWSHAWMIEQARIYGTSYSIDLSQEVAQFEKRNFLEKTLSLGYHPTEHAYQANDLINQFGMVDSRIERANYLNEPAERMAYALGAYFGLRKADALYETPPFLENGPNYPTQKEIRDMAVQIETFIESSSQLMIEKGGYDLKTETTLPPTSGSYRSLAERRTSKPVEYSELRKIQYTRTPATK